MQGLERDIFKEKWKLKGQSLQKQVCKRVWYKSFTLSFSVPSPPPILPRCVAEEKLQRKSILDWRLSPHLIYWKCKTGGFCESGDRLSPFGFDPQYFYSSTMVIFHLNWNSIWEGEEDWNTGCQRNWRIRTTQRGCMRGTTMGILHSSNACPLTTKPLLQGVYIYRQRQVKVTALVKLQTKTQQHRFILWAVRCKWCWNCSGSLALKINIWRQTNISKIRHVFCCKLWEPRNLVFKCKHSVLLNARSSGMYEIVTGGRTRSLWALHSLGQEIFWH